MSDRFSTQRVEVRKNQDATSWYDAKILDIDTNKGTIKVGFEGWPDREVTSQLVRRSATVSHNFDPEVDSMVEVRVTASDSPSGWSLGRIKVIKSSFYFIGFEGVPRDLIVERDVLRPVSKEPPLDVRGLKRATVPLEAELKEWIQSAEAKACLAQVQEKAGLFGVAPSVGEGRPSLTLLGDDKALHRGKLLLEVHLKHQVEIQQFNDRKDKKLKALQDRRKQYEGRLSAEFFVEEDLVGLLIGKGGENIQRIQKKYSVDVRVLEPPQAAKGAPASTARKVRVFGETQEAVDGARGELEFISTDYKIDNPAMVGWILGKARATLNEISKKAGLHYTRLNQGQQTIELCGTRQAIDDAVLLLDSHIQYYDVYQKFDYDEVTENDDGYHGRSNYRGSGGAPANNRYARGGAGGARGGAGGNAGLSSQAKTNAPAASGGRGGSGGRTASGAKGAASASRDKKDDSHYPELTAGGASSGPSPKSPEVAKARSRGGRKAAEVVSAQ